MSHDEHLLLYDGCLRELSTDKITNGLKDFSSRSIAIRAVAKAYDIDLELVDLAQGLPSDYQKISPLGQHPAFEGADGFILTECIAIAIYSK